MYREEYLPNDSGRGFTEELPVAEVVAVPAPAGPAAR
jgi:hypothetical protein